MVRYVQSNLKVLIFVAVVLLGLLVSVKPVGAKEIAELSRTLGDDGYYHEIIDISEYKGQYNRGMSLQFTIKNGKFKSFHSLVNDSKYSAYETFLAVDNVYISQSGIGGYYPNPLEVVVDSPTGDYSIEVHTANTVSDAFDFTNMPIKDGNIVKLKMTTTEVKDTFYSIHLEQGNEYFYLLESRPELQIISPSGVVIKDYQDRSSSGPRKNVTIAGTINAEETGTYIIKVGSSTTPLTFNMSVYEVIDELNELSTLKINDGGKGQYLGAKGYVVKSDTDTPYTMNADVAPGSDVTLYVSDIQNMDDMGAHISNSLLSQSFKGGNNEWYTFYNTNVNVYGNIHEWRQTYGTYAEVDVSGRRFSPKTGDAAKGKVIELNAEDRGDSLIGDPVDAFAGNFTDNRTLLSYSGNNPLTFGLSYDSIANNSKALGGGYTHNFETYIKETESGLDVYWTPNSVVRFTKDGQSYIPVNKNQTGIIVTKTDSGYTVTDKIKQEYVFNADGRLVSFTDKVGSVTTYVYSGDKLTNVSNSKGQAFTFTYNNDDKVSKVVDTAGRELVFEYLNNRLTKVTTPKGYALDISYAEVLTGGSNFKVSSLSYNGVKLVENIYDEQGRVSVQYDGNSNKTTFVYDEHSDNNLITTNMTTGNRTETLVHDTDGNLLSKTDGEGFTVRYTYDSSRNRVSETDKNGHVYTYEYDNLNRLIKEINPDATFKTYEYDTNNNITKLTLEDGKAVISEYNNGQLTSVTDKSGRVITYEYGAFGNVTKINKDNKDIVSQYDENGYLISMKTGENTTLFENDALGRVVKTILPNGKYILTTYDADNNILSSTNINGDVITNEYNAFGNKIKTIDEKGTIITYTYDANGNLLNEKTGAREIVYTYNAFNQMLTRLQKNGSSTRNKETYTYNKRGELISYNDADNIGYTVTYDGNGNLLTKTVGSSVESYAYDRMNRKVSYKDGNGNTTTYGYDNAGNITKETSPSGAVRRYVYDSMNRLVELTDGEGHKTLYKYDVRGNLIKITKPNGAVTQYEYNLDNQQTAVINALGERTENRYNELGQLIEVENPLGEIVQKFEYNNLGKVSTITDGNGHTNQFAYDSKGNLLEVKDALGVVVNKNEYNEYNELITAIDALGNTSTTSYDLFGNVNRVTDSKGKATTYGYSSASRLSLSVDSLGTSSTYTYDIFGNISKLGQSYNSNTTYTRDANQNIIKDSFNLGSIAYLYDSENNVTKKTNARSQEIMYEYDKNGNVTKETTPEGVTNYTYDSVGNQLIAGDITRTYDLLDRVTSKTQNGKKIEYMYDKRGYLSKIMYPDGKVVSYTYDVVGNLLKVVDWNGNETKYEYNANNQLIKILNWNGTSEVRTYDTKGQLVGLISSKGTTVISSYAYEYDVNGNIVKENDTSLTYDALNRLTDYGTNRYTYDKFGSITAFSYLKDDGVRYTRSMRYGYDNQLTSLNGSSVTVDKDGNLTKYPLSSKTYTGVYDSKNRLISFDGINYSYDSENNRISVGDTNFVVDNDSDKYSRVLSEETNGNVTYYVYGNGLIGAYTGDSFETYHYDYRGSVTAVTDEQGAVIGNVTYDEYGAVLSKDASVTGRFLYNGKYGVQTDSNGLYHMRARYYNPDLKRFMNRDIITGDIRESQTLNRYAFVNGNPITYNDPFGLARETANHGGLGFVDWVHLGLDGLGLVPVLGEVADGANALIYLSKGDYTNATISAAGMIPVVGSSATVGRNVVKYGDDAVGLVTSISNGAKDSRKVVDKAKPKVDEPVVDKYNKLKRNKDIPGQAHHLNQDAAYRDVIPTSQGMSVKLEGNAFKDVDSPHYMAHESLEEFWDQYRRGGSKYPSRPTNAEYTQAMVNSLQATGYSQEQAMSIAEKAIQQRIEFGLMDNTPVPRIPGRINQVKRQ